MPKEVPTAPCRGWEGSQAGRGHPQVGCAQGGASVGAGGACLFPEPVGWGGPQREGLAGVGVLSRPAAVATPTTRPALAPSRPPRQQLTRTPPTHCCPWGAGHRRPGRGGGLTLCCAVRNRTLVGSRCLMAAGGAGWLCRWPGGELRPLSGGAWDPRLRAAGERPRQAQDTQRLERCCPLVATSAAAKGSFHLPGAASVSLWATDMHRLLQGLHQGFIGLDADLDLGPCRLVRRPGQFRLRLLQVGPGCLQRGGPW